MTRYYFNENPQVTLLRELTIKSQNAAKESQHIAEQAIKEAKEWKPIVERAINDVTEVNNLSSKLNNILTDIESYSMILTPFLGTRKCFLSLRHEKMFNVRKDA